MIYKYCRRCGKRLKGEENRIRGFGKTCFEKARAEAEKEMRIIVPLSNHPIEIISEQESEETKRRAESKAKRKPKQRAREEKQSKAQEQGKAREQEGETPHLEKTLTPTYKKGLLFTPHTTTPTPER